MISTGRTAGSVELAARGVGGESRLHHERSAEKDRRREPTRSLGVRERAEGQPGLPVDLRPLLMIYFA